MSPCHRAYPTIPHSPRTPRVYVTTGNLASLLLVSDFPPLSASLQAEPPLVTGSWDGEKYHNFSHTPSTLGFVTLCSPRLHSSEQDFVCVCVWNKAADHVKPSKFVDGNYLRESLRFVKGCNDRQFLSVQTFVIGD